MEIKSAVRKTKKKRTNSKKEKVEIIVWTVSIDQEC
jgi:hypothetical protein